MKRHFKSLLWLLIMISSLAIISADTVIAAAKDQTGSESTPRKVVLQQKPTIDFVQMSKNDSSGVAMASLLKIGKKYYDLALPKVEPKLKVDYTILTNGSVSFDGKLTDEKKALELSSIAACANINPDSKYFAIALSCVAFTKAVKNNKVTHNMAAIINLSELPKETGINFKADAVTVYEYAVSLDPKNADTLVNLGNVYMDLDRQEDARILFEAALKLIPKYSRAKEGMATYWLARGDQKKAAEELKKDQIILPGYVRKMNESSEIITDPERAPDVMAGDSLETAVDAINKLKKLKPVSTADFIEEFDPVDAQQIRNKIKYLPKDDLLYLPKITSIAEVSSYDIYYNKTHKFKGYTDTLALFIKKWGKSVEQLQKKNLENMGAQFNGKKVKLPSDMDPAKLKEMAEKAKKDLKDGKMDALRDLMSKFDPEQSKATESVSDSANKIEAYIRTYNMQQLNKKRNAYFFYFMRLCEKYQSTLQNDSKVGMQKIQELRDAEAREIERIENSAMDENVKSAEIKKVKIEYGLKRNKERDNWFHNSFDLMVYQYIQTFKPTMEEMWVDCMPHVKLISDQKSRDKWYADISSLALTNSSRFLSLVLGGAAADGQWDDVTEQDLQNAEEALKEAKEALQESLTKAGQDFQEANEPEGFSLDALLDKFSINQKLGPFEVKLTPNGIEITGSYLIQGKLSYDWEKDSLSAGLGVGVKFGADVKGVQGEVGVSTMLTVTVNTATGKVDEIDWVGNADLSGSIGGVSGGGSYQASVMHGNTFTPALSGAYQQVNMDFLN